MKKRLIYVALALILLGMSWKNPSRVFVPSYPKNWPAPQYDFNKFPLDSFQVDLGRKLFYDPILSADSTISCASCHSPFNAFAHVDHDLSHGIHDSIGTRNAPTIFNLAWQKSFMWDGAIHHIEQQALAPISHPAEMGETIQHVANKLNVHNSYPKLFKVAFRDSVITGQNLLKSLAQFQLTLISQNSKYDLVMAGKQQFSSQEESGYQLFKANCNRCHTEPLFFNTKFANNGLPVDTTLNDWGRYKITLQSSDSLLFKIPTLRNIEYSYPYMHDGRFHSLYEVLAHYEKGITPSSTLDARLKHGIKLSPNEKVDLVAFLLTLSDSAFIFNPNYSFPKK